METSVEFTVLFEITWFQYGIDFYRYYLLIIDSTQSILRIFAQALFTDMPWSGYCITVSFRKKMK